MKKIVLFTVMLMVTLSASLAAEGLFTVHADFSVAFGSVETDYTEKPLKVMGYGIGESMNMQTAMTKARAEAIEQIGRQAAGVDFFYRTTEYSVVLEYFFREEVSGATIREIVPLPADGRIHKVLAIAGVETPVVVPVSGKVLPVSLKQSGDDIERIITGMMKAAIVKAAGMTDGPVNRGIIYLSNLKVTLNEYDRSIQ